jgi:hypothetical protein
VFKLAFVQLPNLFRHCNLIQKKEAHVSNPESSKLNNIHLRRECPIHGTVRLCVRVLWAEEMNEKESVPTDGSHQYAVMKRAIQANGEMGRTAVQYSCARPRLVDTGSPGLTRSSQTATAKTGDVQYRHNGARRLSVKSVLTLFLFFPTICQRRCRAGTP